MSFSLLSLSLTSRYSKSSPAARFFFSNRMSILVRFSSSRIDPTSSIELLSPS
ncbi:hypothetical protein Plhal304r1_c051g0134101 [Plasmopara halstedii]